MATIENKLLEEFERSFNRNSLEKNPYYVYKLTKNLELQLDDIYNERNIKSITQDENLILSALKKCPQIRMLENKKNLVLALQQKKVLVVVNPLAQEKKPEFLEFIKNLLKSAKSSYQLSPSQTNSIKIKFEDQNAGLEFSKQLQNQKFESSDIENFFENEDIYTSLREAVDSKSKRNHHNNTNNINNLSNGLPAAQQNKLPQTMDPAAYISQQQMFQQAQMQNYFFMQQQSLFNSQNFTHLYSPQDFSDLYIRRSRDDNKKKRGGASNQSINAQNGATNGMIFDPLTFMPIDPYYNNGGIANNNNASPEKRQNNHRRGENRKNNNNNKNKSNKNNTTVRNSSNSKNNNRNKSISQKKNNNNPNSLRNASHSQARKTSADEKNSKQVEYQKKKNRPRLESEDFPVLYETNEKGKKEPVQYLVKHEKPTVKGVHTYEETRTKIDKKYNKFEIITSFERWKVDQQICPHLKQFQNKPNIPVVLNAPITKLEVEQPHRKNSTAVTPLLKPNPQTTYRKGSAHYNLTASPNPNTFVKKRVRKFSSQK